MAIASPTLGSARPPLARERPTPRPKRSIGLMLLVFGISLVAWLGWRRRRQRPAAGRVVDVDRRIPRRAHTPPTEPPVPAARARGETWSNALVGCD